MTLSSTIARTNIIERSSLITDEYDNQVIIQSYYIKDNSRSLYVYVFGLFFEMFVYYS